MARRLVTCVVTSLFLSPLALAACASNPPAKPPIAHAGDATHTGATAPNDVETTQQAQSSGIVQISDEIRRACAIDRGDAYFAFDSAHLQNKDVPVLDKVAGCFASGALKGRGMRLVGHADPRGPSEYNMTLGMNRADAVAGYLQRKGVGSSQTETTSRGSMDAKGTNETSWSQDRRVDVLLGR